MQETLLTVHIQQGIHLRPATSILKILEKYPHTEVCFCKGEREVSASSILNILSLNLSYQTQFVVRSKGTDEISCISELKQLIENDSY